jgi:hypothetical protein
MTATMKEGVNVSNLAISHEFRRVLNLALARDRDARFPSADDLYTALTETPEWRSVEQDADALNREAGSSHTVAYTVDTDDVRSNKPD